jgi:hypothetical protein
MNHLDRTQKSIKIFGVVAALAGVTLLFITLRKRA